jgi:hypothetical protein
VENWVSGTFFEKRVKEVTNLGLIYNLLTAYTSFVAIDTQIRLKDGQTVTVKQPLPLPQGVSDYAVGRRSFAGKGICRQAKIIILEILNCIPVVIIFALLDLGKNISFSDTLKPKRSGGKPTFYRLPSRF